MNIVLNTLTDDFFLLLLCTLEDLHKVENVFEKMAECYAATEKFCFELIQD